MRVSRGDYACKPHNICGVEAVKNWPSASFFFFAVARELC